MNQKLKNTIKVLLLLAAVPLLASCASPRSFDTSQGGFSYSGNSTQNAYENCIQTLGPYGQQASCANTGSGQGQNMGNYVIVRTKNGVAPEIAAAEYISLVQSSPASVREGQEKAWNDLAKLYSSN